MEPALPRQTLSWAALQRQGKGRRVAALLLFLAVGAAGCHRRAAPVVAARYRVGLGAAGMSLSPNGKELAVVCSRSNDVWVLSLPTGSLVARIDTLPRPRTVLFHPDGDSFYVAEGLSTVAQIRVSDRRVARQFRPPWRVTHLAWEPGSGLLFAGHLGVPVLGIYRLKDMHLENSVTMGGEVVDVAFSHHQAWVLTRDADGLEQLDLRTMERVAAALTGPDPRSLRLDGPRAWVACHGRAGAAVDLSLPTEAPSPDAPGPLSASAAGILGGGTLTGAGARGAADLSPTAGDLDPRFDGGGVALMRLDHLRRLDYLKVPGGPVALLVSPSGRELAVACEDGNLRLVDIHARRVSDELALGGRPSAMLAAPGGGLLVALSNVKAVLWIRLPSPWR